MAQTPARTNSLSARFFSLFAATALCAAALSCTLAGCAGTPQEAAHTSDGTTVDAMTGSHWRGDSGCADAVWCLPRLEQACDRVIGCTVGRCPRWGWRAAGARQLDCVGALGNDTHVQDAVLLANDCTAVRSVVTQAALPIVLTCDVPTCTSACARSAACIVKTCPGFERAARQQLAANCEAGCSEAGAKWVFQASCSDQLAELARHDWSFEARCGAVAP